MRTSFNPGLIVASVAALLLSACGSDRPVPAPEQTKAAHPVKPTAVPTSLARQTCQEWHPPDDGKDYGPATKPVAVPEQFRSIVSSSKTVITVQGIGEKPGCVKLSWIDSISGLELSSDKRFLGFETSGFEAMGFVIVDRATGAEVEVGGRPIFSGDRTRLASAQTDISSMDGGKGIGVWKIRGSRFVELAYLPMESLPNAQLFQIDRWVGNACVELSSTPNADDDEDSGESEGAAVAAVRHFRLAPEADKWRLKEAAGASPCKAAGQSMVR